MNKAQREGRSRLTQAVRNKMGLRWVDGKLVDRYERVFEEFVDAQGYIDIRPTNENFVKKQNNKTEEKMSKYDYVMYDDRAAAQQRYFKEKFQDLDVLVDALENGRAKAIASTKLEEAYMWVGKAIRDEQIKRNGSAPLQEERKNG